MLQRFEEFLTEAKEKKAKKPLTLEEAKARLSAANQELYGAVSAAIVALKAVHKETDAIDDFGDMGKMMGKVREALKPLNDAMSAALPKKDNPFKK